MPNLNPKTDGREYPVWIIHGPSGSGKTRAAATASAFHKLRPKSERDNLIELEDMMWLQFDKDGLQSLRSMGMEPLFYDFSYMVPELPKWQAAVYLRLDEARAKVASGVKYVVIDTLSTICEYFDAYFLGSANVKDPRLAYNQSLQAFRQLMLHLRALPCAQIWLCHSRSAWVDPDKVSDQQKASRAAAMPGEYDIDLALTNGWKQCIRGQSNLTMGLDVEDNRQRYFITSESQQGHGPRWYVKNRYDDLLQPREPIDLKSIFDRIQAFEANFKKAQT